jgi:hypothetical protein
VGFYTVQSSHSIVRAINSRMRCAGYVRICSYLPQTQRSFLITGGLHNVVRNMHAVQKQTKELCIS